MDMNTIFSTALGIVEPWYIKDVQFDAKRKCLDVELDFRRGSTFSVPGVAGAHKAYDTINKSWRHLNFFEHECHLNARIPRIKTPAGNVLLVEPAWAGLLNGFSLLFEALLLQFARNMPVKQLSKIVNVTEYKIWTILDKYVGNAREYADFANINQIGMDETSIAKGHQYLTMVVDLKEKRTIFVTEGKGNETVTAFKKDFIEHNGDVNKITDVSCDMSPAFIKGVKENLPNAQITFDKFHVLKIINESVDTVRRNEVKDNPILKGKRYIFLKNDSNLTNKQRQEKEELKLSELNLKSMEALNMRETFQQIYQAQTKDDFISLLTSWYHWVSASTLAPMKKAAQMVKNHWDGIVNWKVSNINNGILEGLNSVLQAAKRKARGYKFKHFKTIAYLITGKLDFSRVNPACLPT